MAMPRTLPAPDAVRPPRPGRVRRLRVTLADGARTTVHVAAYDLARTQLRVAVLPAPQRLEAYCAARDVADAIVGGFFTRVDGAPLGEVRTHGVLRRHTPFAAPWHASRACVHSEAGAVRIAPRDAIAPAPRGDLLQAGPLLVQHGRVVFDRAEDREGFSAGAHQFDSDITAARHPRAALALAPGRLLAVACDGRSRRDAGLTLEELAEVLVLLGAHEALNLDGGGSTSLVAAGRLRNRPRSGWETPEAGGRPVSSSLLFLPQS
jgi:hypothetical protein